MVINKYLIIIIIIANIGLLQAQYTAIPDVYFEQELIVQGIDTEGTFDGQVLTSDINTLTELTINNTQINNVIGLQDFVMLVNLELADNLFLSELDLSSNLNIKNINCNFSKLNMYYTDIG